MSNLKPCPFCGRPANLRQGNFWYADCASAFSGCVSMGPFFTKADAIDAWNTRAERTCKVEYRPSLWGSVTLHCGECGADLGCDTRNKQRYCPNCGARVTEE